MHKLDLDTITKELSSLPEWEFKDNSICKTFIFKDFKAAFGFITQVALIAESMEHHPDWSGVNNIVNIKLNTHEIGGVSNNDFLFAHNVEELLIS